MTTLRYLLDCDDEEPLETGLFAFVYANADTLDDEDLALLSVLSPGGSMLFGGGAAPLFRLRCEAR